MHRRRYLAAACLWALAVALTTPGSARASGSADPHIAATNAIVVDAATGDILYARNADERVPPASLTKLITAAVAVEMEPLDTPMTVDPADLLGEASMGLQAGETLTLDTLLHGMLMVSGNDAAMVVARESAALTSDSPWQGTQRFLDRTNARVAALGMANTHLSNPHGLDDPNHYSSAHDLAAITLQIVRNAPELLAIAGTPSWSGQGHAFTNTNELLTGYPGVIAGKTGYTANAGYCLVEIARRGDRTLVAVVLGSTEAAWYADARKLLDFGFSAPSVSGAEPPLGRIELQVTANASSMDADIAGSVQRAGDASLVLLSGPASGSPQWRRLVVGLVGAACVAACLSIGVTRRPRRRRGGAVAAMTVAWQSPATGYDRFSETQPFAFPGVAFSAPAGHTTDSPRFDETAPLPLVDASAIGLPRRPGRHIGAIRQRDRWDRFSERATPGAAYRTSGAD